MTGKAVDSILKAIGNTPVVKLKKIPAPGAAEVYVKLEYYNPTGSYKDRLALAMVEEAEKRGHLRPGMPVVEYTGGSTGSSLAMVCAVKGYRFLAVSSDAFSREKLMAMKAFGAELTIIPSKGGRITPDLTPRMIETARKIVESESGYFTNQLYNEDGIKGYEKIGQELLAQVEQPIDVFCAAVGTAHMLMGVAGILKRENPETRIVVLEPASSAVISGGPAGTHQVEGVGIGFVPPLLDGNVYDLVLSVEEEEAREMARRLAREEGIFAGTSSGLNVAGACRLAAGLGPGHKVATVAVDTGLKYLAGDLF